MPSWVLRVCWRGHRCLPCLIASLTVNIIKACNGGSRHRSSSLARKQIRGHVFHKFGRASSQPQPCSGHDDSPASESNASPRGLASSQAAGTCDWHTELSAYVAPLRRELGAQERPSIQHCMHTGMKSQEQISSENGVGAELKEVARRFMQVGHLLPNKLHTKAEDMLMCIDDHDARSTNTRPSGLASSQARADLFTAGPPCQPWSHMARKRDAPDTHPLFEQFEIVVSYTRRTSPRRVLLDNFLGFVHSGISGGRAAFKYFQVQLSPNYIVGFVEVNLMTWVRIRRPRAFIIFCIHRDVGDEDMRRRAEALADAYEAKRHTHPPRRVEELLSPGEHRLESSGVGRHDIRRREGVAVSRLAPTLPAGMKEEA